jgi:hypothetical protein
MREYVFLGSAAGASSFRQKWIEKIQAFIAGIQISGSIATATDPFFGRLGTLLANKQLSEQLKFELLSPISTCPEEQGVACASFNLHGDHFARLWGLRLRSGEVAHSACVAFGLERLACALFFHHGVDLDGWPLGVRQAMGFEERGSTSRKAQLR